MKHTASILSGKDCENGVAPFVPLHISSIALFKSSTKRLTDTSLPPFMNLLIAKKANPMKNTINNIEKIIPKLNSIAPFLDFLRRQQEKIARGIKNRRFLPLLQVPLIKIIE